MPRPPANTAAVAHVRDAVYLHNFRDPYDWSYALDKLAGMSEAEIEMMVKLAGMSDAEICAFADEAVAASAEALAARKEKKFRCSSLEGGSIGAGTLIQTTKPDMEGA